jgi:hypothetical protein
VAAGDVAAAAGELDDAEVLAGDVFAEAGEVFAAEEAEVCACDNPAGRAARRAIAISELIGFMETESFY